MRYINRRLAALATLATLRSLQVRSLQVHSGQALRPRSGQALLLLWFVVILALPLVASAQGTGSLEGLVVNGTADGPAVGAGLPVMLHVLRGDARVDTLETTTDADGSFRFDGLETDASLEYWPEVVYLDVAYTSAEPVQFDGEEPVLGCDMAIKALGQKPLAELVESVEGLEAEWGRIKVDPATGATSVAGLYAGGDCVNGGAEVSVPSFD